MRLLSGPFALGHIVLAVPQGQAQVVGVRLSNSGPLRFSVIIPTLNEEQMLGSCLSRLQSLSSDAEVIVADGGSQDMTRDIARHYGATFIQAQRGRGQQCNAGVQYASGDVLLFLYADTLLPSNAFDLLNEFFADEEVQIGTFRLQFDIRHWLLDPAPLITQLDSVYTKFGDQCIVVRRSFFYALGGFPDWPLFEDVRLFEKARFQTCIYSFPACVTTSARKYMQRGILANHWRNIRMIVQYLFGVSPEHLAKEYWEEHSAPNLNRC